MRIKRFISFMVVAIVMGTMSFVNAQEVAIKNNLIYDALKTPNLSLEIGLSNHWTLDTQMGANFFFYTKNPQSSSYKTKKWSHWLIQPEARYWTCEKFNGWFVGGHILGGMMNVGGVKLPSFLFLGKSTADMNKHRYEGYFYGAGVSAGYQWVLGKRWNLEASLGLGYVRFEYDKFRCTKCGDKLGSGHANYVGPTKATISIAYFLK